jgi:hypothetical protein
MTRVCEEFSVEELTSQLPNLKGLPVCIEHDSSELIGSVTEAVLTHSGAVYVRAIVSASTAAGKRAISDIRSKKMVGLSLSHRYDLIPRNGSALKIVRERLMGFNVTIATCLRTLPSLDNVTINVAGLMADSPPPLDVARRHIRIKPKIECLGTYPRKTSETR